MSHTAWGIMMLIILIINLIMIHGEIAEEETHMALYHRNIKFNKFLGYDRYEINDVTILKDLFEAKILADILDLRNPNAEPIGFTATVELVNSYIDRYNRLHKAGCRTVSDVADFEIMRIRAGKEYSLGDL